MARPQLPVYSPVRLASLLQGGASLVAGGTAALASVAHRVREGYGAREVLLLDSGTSALHTALRAAADAAERRGGARLVALPGYGCFDLATAAVGADVRVLLYDLDPATLGPDWASLARVLARRPAAVVVAHLYGIPIDAPRAAAMAAAVGAVLVDDAAQGVGAAVGGRPVGSHGSLGVLSFGRGKGRTGGGGGALLAHDERGVALLAGERDRLRRASRGAKPILALGAQWLFGRPSLYWIPASLPFLGLGETPYHPPHPPAAMPAACAAALLANWEASEREAAARRDAAAAWRASPLVRGWSFPAPDRADAVRGELRLAALVPEGQAAAEVAHRMGGGVMRGYPLPLAQLPALAGVLEAGERCDGARTIVERLLTLPTVGRVPDAGFIGAVEAA